MNNNAKDLLAKYHAGTATDEEKQLVENWLLHGNNGPLDISENEFNSDLDELRDRMEEATFMPQRRKLWPRIAAAASILIALGVGGYYFIHKEQPQQLAVNRPLQHDVAPGKNTATLTLANGQKIILSNALTGQIAKEVGVNVTKTANGGIVYTIADNNEADANQFNTLITAKGETYKVNLPDGTQVWLNAASSLTYPTRFTGAYRKVRLTGEGYFEVAKDKAHPFIVSADKQDVTVLGTHFNVNAYNNEPDLKTTLLEGSVKISNRGQSAVLKPGQQASVQWSDEKIRVAVTNTKQAVAWKDGEFIFEHTELKTLMRQVARWYDLDIVYKGDIANDEFNGEISRDVNLSKMLHILESGDVHFKIITENNKKKLIITP
ncbi:FecR family protein [Mucilaginibacter gracilis]|nr:FecR family protein [Mucilaginibacter gracilis]